MKELNQKLQEYQEIKTDGGKIPETDAMGREKFWEDIGRPNE